MSFLWMHKESRRISPDEEITLRDFSECPINSGNSTMLGLKNRKLMIPIKIGPGRSLHSCAEAKPLEW